MAVIDAIKAAILRVDGRQVQEVFASSDQVCVEMADLSNDVARDILASHDWRDLTRIETLTGDGVIEAFPKPADYDRMMLASWVEGPGNWLWGYFPFGSVNDWMGAKSGAWVWIDPGGWIIVGGEFHFWPAPSGSAAFPYVSNRFAKSEDGAEKSSFTADSDTFFLGDRILTLGCVWRWKEQKGLEYAEDMANYELALNQLQAKDKGARVIRSMAAAPSSGSRVAYPFSLG